MKELTSLILVFVCLASLGATTGTRNNESVSRYGPFICADGSVVLQEDECPEWYTVREVGPDGTIYRRTCKLRDEDRRIAGWDWILIPGPIPIPVPIPEMELWCDYGPLCGEVRHDEANEGIGSGGTDS